jgi:hypothetical protein
MRAGSQSSRTTSQRIEGGFPHSEIPGSKLVRSSPRLIAAYHVLHRLSAPRHPPNALKTLDRSHDRCSLTGSRYKQPTVTSRSQKDRSPSPFENSDLMLAEHDRNGPAFAAATATFPLNDVDFASSGTWPLLAANLVFPDTHASPFATVAQHARLVQTGGASRDRTDDLMLAKQPLSQLSYGPNSGRCEQIARVHGGPGTTRTSDLTLIRGAL